MTKDIMPEDTKMDLGVRIAQLRETILYPAGVFQVGEVTSERALAITESYQKNEGCPSELKRARALEHILDKKSLYIQEGELIVGNVAPKPLGVNVYPEINVDWILNELDLFSTRDADRFLISDDTKRELKEVCEWWRGRTVADRIAEFLGPEEMFYKDRLVFHSMSSVAGGQNAVIVDYPKVLNKGLNGIRDEVEEQLKKLDLGDPENLKKSVFYRAVLISLDAVIRFAERYAKLARESAMRESDPTRKAELEAIAEVCNRVPGNPARTFQEALQAFWFTYLALGMDTSFIGITPGRMDQYLYPFYQKDISEGKLTKEAAQTLIECLWIKFNEGLILLPELNVRFYSGQPTMNLITIGGVTREGLDATNELSYLMLDSELGVRMRQPEIVVPIHGKTPGKFLRHAAELVRQGTSKPKFFMAETLQHQRACDPHNYAVEEIRDTTWVGCGENGIPGCERAGVDTCWHTGLILMLELALNNGVSRISGEKIGLETGDPGKFESFSQLMKAYKKQVANAIRHRCIHSNAVVMALRELLPVPFRSALVSDCIEKGLDYFNGGPRYNSDVGLDSGLTTAGDALAALKKLVFDEKKVTMTDMIDALDANFEGKEDLRQMCLEAPKFGNDDDYVDLLTRELAVFVSQEYGKHTHVNKGGFHKGSLSSVTAGIPLGGLTGATPDGRKAGEPSNEGGVSPHQGRDKKGPTAVMKSVSKLDWSVAGGGVLNIKFSPKALEGDGGLDTFCGLLKAYNQMGGFHVQFNCVDTATLRYAQEHPEKHRDLLVRVAAYSAYFVHLPKSLQEEIIARTEHQTVY